MARGESTRLAIDLALWVMLGAVLTVFAAAVAILTAPADLAALRGGLDAGSHAWPHPYPADWTLEANSAWTTRGVGWWATSFHDRVNQHLAIAAGKDVHEFVMVDSHCGLPFPALGCWTTHEWRRPETVSTYTHTCHGGWECTLPVIGAAVIPHTPFWPGFALNTLFYAAIAWGLWQLPVAIHRGRRRGKGRCVRCGYALSGLPASSPCPECGKGR